MKVVINTCFGGFSLSPEALLWLHAKDPKIVATPKEEYFKNTMSDKLFGFKGRLDEWRRYKIDPTNIGTLMLTVFSDDEKFVLSGGRSLQRDHPLLVECVETLGKKADGPYAKLEVIEIPDGVDYTVEEYDGSEHIAEAHRTWP